MPVHKKDDGWYWGSKGPFPTKQKAIQVGQAAYASGYREEAQMDKELTAQFIGTLLHSATLTHFKHWLVTGVGSDAAHRALGDYYDEIVDLVDSLTESIQGAYDELIQPYADSFDNSPLEPLPYMRALRQYVRTQRAGLPQDSEIQNEIDGIATLINHTIYRLTFLK
jgi:DNA-binding ferritin-like protein